MNKQVQQIRAEIERLKANAPREVGRGAGTITATGYGIIKVCDHLLSFLDTLPEQPVEGLEEEIREYMSNEDNNPFDWDWRDKRDCARHFAEWGMSHSFTHHEPDESLEDAVLHQMEDDGDVDDFTRKGIDEIAMRYAKLGAEWGAEHLRETTKKEDEK